MNKTIMTGLLSILGLGVIISTNILIEKSSKEDITKFDFTNSTHSVAFIKKELNNGSTIKQMFSNGVDKLVITSKDKNLADNSRDLITQICNDISGYRHKKVELISYFGEDVESQIITGFDLTSKSCDNIFNHKDFTSIQQGYVYDNETGETKINIGINAQNDYLLTKKGMCNFIDTDYDVYDKDSEELVYVFKIKNDNNTITKRLTYKSCFPNNITIK